MTKIHSKKLFFSLMVAGLFVSAGSILAADITGNTGQNAGENGNGIVGKEINGIKSQNDQNICARITDLSVNLTQKATNQENTIKTNQQNRLTNWTQKTGQVDATLAANRAAWANNLNQQFAKLDAKAQTDAQKQAVATFESAVKAAIATRQAAVDAAMKIFRDGVKTAITSRQGQVDGVVSSFATARKTALAKAQADCTANASAATVRADFKTGMQSARTQFQADRQNVTKVGTTVQALVQTRQSSVDAAVSAFKSAVQQAGTTLKQSFPNDSASTTTTTVPATN